MTSSKVYVPERFRRVVFLHVVKNLMIENSTRPPLLLGIHGPSGDGKTYQCEHLLEEAGVRAFLISGGQLENYNAGEPANLIRETYLKAGKAMEKESAAAVILINDIDTGVGNWGDLVQYTVNRQNVFGELMHLVDYPTSVGNMAARRIPIIITGNDLTKLYEPLVRAGRMTAFEWKPTVEEKVLMINPIFPELSPAECSAFVTAFSKQPVAFFSALRSRLIDDELYREIQRVGIRRIIAFIRVEQEPDIQSKIRFEHLIQVGKEFVASGQLVNHLKGA